MMHEFFVSNFELEFLTCLTYQVIKRPYSPDDIILEEGSIGEEIFLTITGSVAIIH